MPATLHLPAVLARLSEGRRTIEVFGATVGDAVADVSSRFPALGPRLRDDGGSPYPFITYYVNDQDIRHHGGFAAVLHDGDEVLIVPAVAGG